MLFLVPRHLARAAYVERQQYVRHSVASIHLVSMGCDNAMHVT